MSDRELAERIVRVLCLHPYTHQGDDQAAINRRYSELIPVCARETHSPFTAAATRARVEWVMGLLGGRKEGGA